ncbi:MAG: peptidoglycan editing factor PgeF [Campylobacterota bacterium]|nr:peptidoglycan editing factor PgeF [Campylobacterota bacterium]
MSHFYHFAHFKKHPSLLHAITMKSAEYPYDFSLALHTGEKAQSIVANREKLSTLLGGDEALHYIVANQTHSDHIEVITEKKNRGWNRIEDAIESCDALISNLPGIVLTILTADCVPILLYDREKSVIAAIHAGWRGTEANITLKTVQKMQKVFGCNPKDIIAGIAPSIGACCYEVGKDVAEHFFDTPESFTLHGEKYMLDLPYLNKQQLLKAGVDEMRIEMSNRCTACEVTRFFSYRKEKGCSGRFMSMIGLRRL